MPAPQRPLNTTLTLVRSIPFPFVIPFSFVVSLRFVLPFRFVVPLRTVAWVKARKQQNVEAGQPLDKVPM